MAAALDSLDQIRATVIDLTIKFGPKLLAALLILGLGFLIGRWSSRWLERGLARPAVQRGLDIPKRPE